MSYIKFSQFETATDKNGMNLVGVRDGKNVKIPAEEIVLGLIGDAPDDGIAYVRKSTDWVKISETDEYNELSKKSDVDSLPKEIKISIIKETTDAGECHISARIENNNLIPSSYLNDCKLFLLRIKRKKPNPGGYDQNGISKTRKYCGRAWAETGVGLYWKCYDHGYIQGDLSEKWPDDTYMWSLGGEIISLFGGRDLNNIDSLPPGIRSYLYSDNRRANDVPLGIKKIIESKVPGLVGSIDYKGTDFYFTRYKNLTCATLGVAVYKETRTLRNTKGHTWQRVSNIAAFKVKENSIGKVAITIL